MGPIIAENYQSLTKIECHNLKETALHQFKRFRRPLDDQNMETSLDLKRTIACA